MIIYPPNPIPEAGNAIFLAGSIEQDHAQNWQELITQNIDNENIIVLNPRRKDWDQSWKEEIENPYFLEQVEWELKGQERADLIIMYFDPDTQSPVSLLELGLFAQSRKMIVCCPKGFWKKGNVDIVCRRYNIVQVESLNELIEKARSYKF
ncbi:MAG: nucleoside 2-deoxyribosyltransferase domain-containing protein [Bacteroidales bacterium]